MGEKKTDMKQVPYPPYEQKALYTVAGYIEFCRCFGDQTAFISHENKTQKAVSYRQFARDAVGFAKKIASLIPAGTHVALLGENSYLWFVCLLAVMLGGNTAVPLDASLPAGDLNALLLHSDAGLLLYSDSYADEPVGTDLKKLSFSALAALVSEEDKNGAAPSFDPDRPALIVYTSGSTGGAKGVMLSEKNIITNAVATKRHVLSTGTTVSVLPFSHTYIMTATLSVLLDGCTVHVGTKLSRLEKDLKEVRPDFMLFVPVIIENLHRKIMGKIDESGRRSRFLLLMKTSDLLLKLGIDLRRRFFKDILTVFGGRLIWIGCGGAPLKEEIAKDFRSWGIEIICAYGLTECSPVVTSNRNDFNVLGSVGTVVSGCEIKTDPPGGIGEILIRGENVMLGYYKDDKATAGAFREGWFRTGDLGRITDKGLLYLTGRKKNLILFSNGKNVSPEELENRLTEAVPEIKEVIVSGENEKIAAEIFPAVPGEENEKHIREKIASLNRELPAYKQISAVRFRTEAFPKTSTGKIRRNGDKS